MRTILPIKTEDDYNRAMERLEEIFDAEPNTPEDDELAVLGILIDEYEKEHYPLDMPDPIEAIKFRMEQMGLEKKDLVETLGSKSRVSEILNKKRKLSLSMIRKLHRTLNIPSDVLIQEY
jgi:HTH-type transcriptional regulator/antitoxin HigA